MFKSILVVVFGSVPALIAIHDFLAYRSYKQEKNRFELLRLKLETLRISESMEHPFGDPSPVEESEPENSSVDSDSDLSKEAAPKIAAKAGDNSWPTIEKFQAETTRELLQRLPIGIAITGVAFWISVNVLVAALAQVWTWPMVAVSFAVGGFALMGAQAMLLSLRVLIERLVIWAKR